MLQLAPLVFILLVMGCVADERSRGTAITVLTKPVPRALFVLAKLCAYELTLALSLVLTAAGTYYYTSVLFSSLPLGAFCLINLALFLVLSIVLSFTVLTSTFFRNAIAAGGLAFLGYIALIALPNLNTTILQAFPTVLLNGKRVSQLIAGSAATLDTLKPLLIGTGLVALLALLACLTLRWQEI